MKSYWMRYSSCCLLFGIVSLPTARAWIELPPHSSAAPQGITTGHCSGRTKSSALAASSPSFSKSTAKSICFFDDSDFAGQVGDWPYQASDLNRLDNSADDQFYAEPRFVTHIDEGAIASLTSFYENELQQLQKQQDGAPLDILDLCSSWISHFPQTNNDNDLQYGRVVGLGMNEKELAANSQLTEFVVQDLNDNPSLSQFEDNSFDVICNVVSVDYLTQPRAMFQEMHRILKPGGVALMSFSNRCFPTKAVAMWLQADDIGRLTIVASYFHYAATWKTIEALDLKGDPLPTPKRPKASDILSNPAVGWAWMNSAAAVAKQNQGDPMFVVKAIKK